MITEKQTILNQLITMKDRITCLSSADKQYIQNIQIRVLRRPFVQTNCRDCYKDALIEMYNYLNKNELMQKSNYTLKAGVVAQSATLKGLYTNANLTDQAAEAYLQENPKRINFFATYPPDWQNKINQNPKPKKPKTKTP